MERRRAEETAAELCLMADECPDFSQLQALGVPQAAVQLLGMKAALSRQIADLEQRERKLWEMLVAVIEDT